MGTQLPPEIIENILCRENVAISDIVNFSLTNRHYYNVITNNTRIWKQIYFKTWPQFSEVMDKNNLNCNWYREVKYICNLKHRTHKIIGLMSSRSCKPQQQRSEFYISPYTEWLHLYHEKPRTYYYLVDNLMSIVNTQISINSIEVVPITTPGNKTLQYYAMLALTFLRKLHLSNEWQTFTPKEQTSEKWVAFIIQWCRPDIDMSWKKFAIQLDKIAEEVKERLKMVYPNHPLFTVSIEKLNMWRNANIKGNKYRFVHSIQLAYVLAECWNFFHSVNVLIEFLEVPSRTFIRIVTLIMRESVGRRLGLKYNLCGDSSEYIMLLSNKYDFEEDISAQDDYLADNLLVLETLVKYVGALFPKTLASRCIQFPTKELPIFLFPNCIYHYIDLAYLYIYYNVDVTWYTKFLLKQKAQISHPEQLKKLIDKLQKYTARKKIDDNFCKEISAKVRPPNLKYAVGMVMYYVKFRNHERLKCNGCCSFMWPCVGVICDWDVCESFSDRQPVYIYNVLFHDGSNRIVVEDVLEPVFNQIDALRLHLLENVGRHFSHVFDSHHFVPNAVKEKQYPADRAVRHSYYYLKVEIDAMLKSPRRYCE